jgi:Cu(I)/Ag(I) efflux system membrane fusion protein
MTKTTIAVPLALLLVLAGIAGTVLLPGCGNGASHADHAAKKWICPMHPEIVKDGPGDCPICGMKLVPAEPAKPDSATRTEGTADRATITIEPEKARLLGLKTAAVTKAPLSTSIRTVGRVLFDERRVHHVHTRYEAFVEHVTADFTGKYVQKGEVLAHVYSPELFATQQEYLLALKASRSLVGSSMPGVATGGKELLEAARQRLLLWQIAPEDIAAIEKNGEPLRTVPLYAPISGYVIARTAYHGMKVMPADTLFDIVDLSSVWVVADVYEYELPRLKLGQKATVTLAYWPGKEWGGPVTYIYPAVDEKSRTVKVRIDVTNPNGDLKPEMFAEVVIRGSAREALAVPDDAVLDSGTRKIVFLSPGEGKLVPREVEVGERAGGKIEIRKGLAEGDVVALGANFLVDSESQLRAALAGMTAGEGAKTPVKEPK